MKLSPAQVRFLEGCLEFERGENPRGMPCSAADMRTHSGLLQRGLIAHQIWVREYVLTPQGRLALRKEAPDANR